MIIKEEIVLKGGHGREFLVDTVYDNSAVQKPVIVFSHGFKGFKDWGPFNVMARHFAEAGFIFVKLNFAFNGTTLQNPYHFDDLDAFGNNNFSKELNDLNDVLDWVWDNSTRLNADISKVSLMGHSRGGGVSILKAYEDSRVSSVVTWAGVADFAWHITKEQIDHWKKHGVIEVENARTKQMMPLYLQIYDDYMKNHRRFNIRNAVMHLTKPILIAHGSDDDTVPFEHAEELMTLNPAKVNLLKIYGGDHTFGAAHPHETEVLPFVFSDVVLKTQLFLKSL